MVFVKQQVAAIKCRQNRRVGWHRSGIFDLASRLLPSSVHERRLTRSNQSYLEGFPFGPLPLLARLLAWPGGPECSWFVSPNPCPGRPPDPAIAFELIVVDRRKVTAGG